MLVFIRQLSLSTLRWVPMCQGFNNFSGFLHHFVFAKLANSRVYLHLHYLHLWPHIWLCWDAHKGSTWGLQSLDPRHCCHGEDDHLQHRLASFPIGWKIDNKINNKIFKKWPWSRKRMCQHSGVIEVQKIRMPLFDFGKWTLFANGYPWLMSCGHHWKATETIISISWPFSPITSCVYAYSVS